MGSLGLLDLTFGRLLGGETLPFADKFTLPLQGGVVNRANPFLFERPKGVFHTGIDLNLPGERTSDLGTSIISPANGTCVFAGMAGEFGLGNVVILKHRIRIKTLVGETNVYSLMAHLDKVYAGRGWYYKVGEQIGTLGMSGGQESPHLHFEIMTEDHLQEYVQRLGVNYPFGKMGRDYLVKAYYDPESFISFRNRNPEGGVVG